MLLKYCLWGWEGGGGGGGGGSGRRKKAGLFQKRLTTAAEALNVKLAVTCFVDWL